LQKQDEDEDKSLMATGREFQGAGPQTAKLVRGCMLLLAK